MVVGENKRTNIMDGIENTGDVRMHDHRLRLKQRFDIVRKLGQGTYGKVQLGINKKTGQEVAIKTIKKCKIESEADLVRIRREVQIMSSVRHPNIVHIYEVFENSEKMILVMEYCSGGELYDYLSQKKVLEEDEARRLFRQIATAVYYCHIHKICHRDLKLENVLLDDTGSAKIADFGLSNVFKETSLLSTFCGSPLYASPEIVKGTPYIGPEVDCWSLGVLLYTLVYGAMPFDGSNFKRLVRQISNGDYYEPKSPSSASPLIRDMLTVDPVKRADIAYICDNSWVNAGCEMSCLEEAEALAAETPVRLDLLLSLAPAAPNNSNSVVVPSEGDLGPEESGTDLTSSTSMAVEPSNSAEKRILELVAEGGEDAIKPSPTRTIVSASDNKRKLEMAMSASGLQRKKEHVASSASVGPQRSLPEEAPLDPPAQTSTEDHQIAQPSLKSSATMTIAAAPAGLVNSATKDIVKETIDDAKEKGVKQAANKSTPAKPIEKLPTEIREATKMMEPNASNVTPASDKLTSQSLAAAAPAPAPPPVPTPTATPAKPKKLSIGGSVGSFKEQFERRASLTAPDVKRNLTKPVGSKIAKPKAQSEDRELSVKAPDNGTVRLQQIGIEPSRTPIDEVGPARHVTGGVKKTESEPTHNTGAADTSVLLQDARRSLQSSMAKLVEEKANEEHRRRAARDIISSAIRTGKPPMPYGRSSSAGVTSLTSPPGTPPAAPPTAPPTAPSAASRLYRTEAQHRVEDHRNRGVSVERIIPIHVAPEATPTCPPPQPKPAAVTSPQPHHVPLRRLVSTESSGSGAGSEAGEPIKKSPREFIIPIAVEGKGYVTPRQRSLEPEAAPHAPAHRARGPHKRGPLYSSIVSGGESDDEDDTHSMHRLRSSRAARAESVSSGEEDEEDERFHLLTAENLFSTLLHRVRALTNRLNGEEGPGFPQHPRSLLQSPFFNRSPSFAEKTSLTRGMGLAGLPHGLRLDLQQEPPADAASWVARYTACSDQIFTPQRLQRKPQIRHKLLTTIGNNKKSGKHQAKSNQNAETNTASGLDLSDLDLNSIQFSEKEMKALSGLTPALSRRLQRQLLASLPPAAASTLRRTLSLHATTPTAPAAPSTPATPPPTAAPSTSATPDKTDILVIADTDLSTPQFCTLPRLKRSVASKETTPPLTPVSDTGYSYNPKMETLVNEPCPSKGSSIRSTPDRPLLSKYLTPDRNLSLDESYSSDSGSILSEPSYMAAYGPSTIGSGFRRHSMRLSGDREAPKKRISRFLRPDFFDVPPDESLYAKHKKEKELETQKILKEIREKKNKANDASSMRCSTEASDGLSSDSRTNEGNYSRKCLSPISILTSKERSRSITPFFPILDNIKETVLDSSLKLQEQNIFEDSKRLCELENINKETKLTRPKSYPVKNLDAVCPSDKTMLSDIIAVKDNENKDRVLNKESKLIRPKSYPSSNSSPEKTLVNSQKEQPNNNNIKEESNFKENKSDVEVTFSFSLPKKNKRVLTTTTATNVSNERGEEKTKSNIEQINDTDKSLTLKKYQIIDDTDKSNVNTGIKEVNDTKNVIADVSNPTHSIKNNDDANGKEQIIAKVVDNDIAGKKGTIKKKIIRKVSSKSNSDIKSNQESNESKAGDKKKITKKIKDKNVEDSTKPAVTKKKSVLQSIGQKLEKFASTKSSSPEKNSATSIPETKKDSSKPSRTQREQSVPVNIEPTESILIKRAVTLTDVAALDNPNVNSNKTTVSKVLGLFKKFEPKEKSVSKIIIEKSELESNDINNYTETSVLECLEKPKRPTSLLLNGCKNNIEKTSSEEVTRLAIESDNQSESKKDEPKTLRNSLKLDFSRLPRVKKIVPTNSVIEPQFMNVSPTDKDTKIKEIKDKSSLHDIETSEILKRSRSRSKSILSNSELGEDTKCSDKLPSSPVDTQPPLRNHESTSPEKEDIVDRIRRKSFYSRFNEKKQRRKSNLVGPGATEYDPVARLHGPPSDTKYDLSPSSGAYDLCPGFSNVSDLSPTERYRPFLNELSIGTKNNSRYDTFALNDKVDSYRSLDRNDFRKYSGNRSYLDCIQPSTFGSNRYSRTKSLLDSSDEPEDNSILSHQRDPHKYNRTISMYSPGSYATYRPKRTRNSAIILKESEKEPSPENILEKIRQRKNISISVTRKPESEKNTLPRSNISSKGEDDGTECSKKID